MTGWVRVTEQSPRGHRDRITMPRWCRDRAWHLERQLREVVHQLLGAQHLGRSVDVPGNAHRGRITVNSSSILMQPHAAAQLQTLKPAGTDEFLGARRSEHGATATLEGSGSFGVPSDPAPVWPATEETSTELFSDWIPRRAPHWFVVADSRGRVDWSWGRAGP